MVCLSHFDNCVVTSAARKQCNREVRVGEKKRGERSRVRTYVSEPRDEANELRGALNHEHGTDSGLLETGFSPKNFISTAH